MLAILVVHMCHSQVGIFGCFLPLATFLVSSSARKANPLGGYFMSDLALCLKNIVYQQ